MSAANDVVLRTLADIGERAEAADVMERAGLGHRVVCAALEALVAEGKVRHEEVGDVQLYSVAKGVKLPKTPAPELDDWRHEIVTLLRSTGPIRPREALEQLRWATISGSRGYKRLQVAVFEGLVEAVGATHSRRIGLPGSFGANGTETKTDPAKAAPRRRKTSGPGNAHEKIARCGRRAPTATSGTLGDLLQRNADQAHAALDEYVVACCDPQKLAVLKAHRDAARAAVREFSA